MHFPQKTKAFLVRVTLTLTITHMTLHSGLKIQTVKKLYL
jgi:hypothetical protein